MIHPLEKIVQSFLSSDGTLLPETIRQLHCIEGMIVATVVFGLLFFFFRNCRFPLFWIIMTAAILLRVVSAERGFETMEFFDSVHYTVPAANLVEHGTFTIPINENGHPYSKAPGFSLLIAPIYFFVNNLGAAVWIPMIAGIASVLFLYLITKELAGPRVALIAMFLLAVSPLHINYSRIIMPSMVPLCLILIGTALLVKYPDKLKMIFFASLLFGLAITVRYLTIAVVPAALVYLLARHKKIDGKLFGQTSLFFLGIFIFLGGLFLFQYKEYGSSLLTGYSYWEHFFPTIQRPFSIDYAFHTPPTSGGSPNAIFSLISATGAHILYPNILFSRPDQIAWAALIILFALVGLRHLRHRNRPIFLFIVTFFILYYIPHALLYSQGAHFMLPVVPFVIIAAALGLETCYQKLGLKSQTIVKGTFLAINLSLVLFAYPLMHPPFARYNREFIDLLKENLPQGSYLISDYDAVLFTYEVGRRKNITFIALAPQVAYADRQLYFKGQLLPPPLWNAVENTARVKELVKSGQGVFMAIFNEEKYAEELQKLSGTFTLESLEETDRFRLYKVVR